MNDSTSPPITTVRCISCSTVKEIKLQTITDIICNVCNGTIFRKYSIGPQQICRLKAL